MRNLIVFIFIITGLLEMNQAKQCYDSNLVVSCKVGNKDFFSINSLQLSKIQTNDIVLIHPIPNPQKADDYSVKWQNTAIQRKASTDKSVIFPWNQAQLVMEIQKDNIEITDIGQYWCRIKGLNINMTKDEDIYKVESQVKVVSCPVSNGVMDPDSGWSFLAITAVIVLNIVTKVHL